MDIERISKDERTREAWTVQLIPSGAGADARLRVKIVYYMRQTRPDKRHKWTMAVYWHLKRVGGRRDELDAPPRIPDDVILEALRNRMVVEWPAEGGG